MMARLILSAGILSVLASRIAFLRRGFPSGSPPPIRAAIVISLMNLVKARPRFESIAAFLCLILCHLEWPDIDTPQDQVKFGSQFSKNQLGTESKNKGALPPMTDDQCRVLRCRYAPVAM